MMSVPLFPKYLDVFIISPNVLGQPFGAIVYVTWEITWSIHPLIEVTWWNNLWYLQVYLKVMSLLHYLFFSSLMNKRSKTFTSATSGSYLSLRTLHIRIPPNSWVTQIFSLIQIVNNTTMTCNHTPCGPMNMV